MTNTISPLQAINQKELELRRQAETAQRQAEAQVQAAYEKAKKNVVQADQEGRAEAEAIFQRGVEEALQQAEAIVVAANEDATKLRVQATTRLDEVASQIVALVLPGSESV